MEAPPGFEPGMEVLQSGRPLIRFVRKQARNERSQLHANRPLYAPVRRNRPQYAPHGIKNGITFGRWVAVVRPPLRRLGRFTYPRERTDVSASHSAEHRVVLLT